MTLDKSPNLVHCSVPAYEMELTVPFSQAVVTVDCDCSWLRLGTLSVPNHWELPHLSNLPAQIPWGTALQSGK